MDLALGYLEGILLYYSFFIVKILISIFKLQFFLLQPILYYDR